MKILLFLLLSSYAFSKDNWLCESDSTQRQGSDILACGVGEGTSEATARKLAMKSAKAEFRAVCDANTACGQRGYSIEPKRLTCSENEGQWKCYRLLVFHVEQKERKRVVQERQHWEPQSIYPMHVGNFYY